MTSKTQLLTLCFGVFLTLGSCSDAKKDEPQTPPQAPPPIPVETVTVQKEAVPIWLEYTGKTEATQRIEVRARVSGVLEKVFFKDGDFVEEGQQLFSIEKTSYQAALDQVLAVVEQDRASLKLAVTDVERYRPLVLKDLAPQATLDQYIARADELRARIKADQAAVRGAELRLSYTDVLAPKSGRVGRRQVDTGNIVGYSEQTLLTTIIFDDPMYAYFNPSEENFQIMRQHKSVDVMPAKIRVPDNRGHLIKREAYKGKVDFGDNRVDHMTGTITMRAIVDNPEHDLLEGTFVYVDVFVSDQAKFTMVPPGIVMEDQQGSFVYTVDENSKAKRVNIKRGFESRYYLQIKDGLEDGAKVIVSGLQKVSNGREVTTTDATATKSVRAVMQQQKMTATE
ncbi:MAG: efflux RND transporter periplasmic adaptor subunit [Desulfocapsa sp.]|nr:efflux RND transporter periplasmic adaptor subunit [Desulfocapsa sp.]MBN4052885.1 efflux RND transporter periplasmic adaptor subunit [bacterium AH-315-K15]